MAIRDIEVRLTGLEDGLLEKFGYREFGVRIGTTELEILPQVKERDVSSFSPTQLTAFANSLGSSGNPTTYFELTVSRLIDSDLIRSFDYWYLVKEGIEIKCMPVSLVETDSRYIVILGVLKQNA